MPMKRPAETQNAPDRTGTVTLANRWRIRRRDVRRLLATGELPFVQIRGQIRVPSEAVARHEQQ